ncbi:MAG: DUF488 domain-containing protein [Thaumarchaeota archaeon]|nr:DUF488 domain-containing protein [Nitrososphaerota archaeon]
MQESCVYTIGHSTRTIKDFIQILNSYEISQVVDVRTIPRSRHNPQFNRDTLANSLKNLKIKYLHLPKLGGLRRPLPDSVNRGWRNASFRGYADYMQTDEFKSALRKVIELSKNHRIALMCAESVPWRCHRTLIADALLVQKIQTNHLFSVTASKKHTLTPWAKVRGNTITYPEPIIDHSPET